MSRGVRAGGGLARLRAVPHLLRGALLPGDAVSLRRSVSFIAHLQERLWRSSSSRSQASMSRCAATALLDTRRKGRLSISETLEEPLICRRLVFGCNKSSEALEELLFQATP